MLKKIASRGMDMKKILLLTTGGTIASLPGGQGLEPRRSEVMELALDQLRGFYDITVEDLMCLDSSNITPEEWQLIARRIFEDRTGYDGIVVSHGTDTMAYTASAVTFMLPNIDLPVVFTGSQLPLADMLSDGPANLRTAFAMAASAHPGVFLAFDRKVMLGCRAVEGSPPLKASMPATPPKSPTADWWWTRRSFPIPRGRLGCCRSSAGRFFF